MAGILFRSVIMPVLDVVQETDSGKGFGGGSRNIEL